jgi:hypothetical protein
MTNFLLLRMAQKLPREPLAARLRIPDILLRYLEQGMLQPSPEHRDRFREVFGPQGDRLLERADIPAALGTDGAAVLEELRSRLSLVSQGSGSA